MIAWLDRKLADARSLDERYEPSLRELLIAGSRVRLPDGVAAARMLTVSCYAGEIEIPIDHGWVTAPADPPQVPDPIAIRLANLDGAVRLVLEVFWSAWAGDAAPVASIRDGLSRLTNRGWRSDD